MTEDEARTKWCPQARIEAIWPSGGAADEDSFTGYRVGSHNVTEDGPASNCIASYCMMWRWIYPDLGGFSVDESVVKKMRTHGYCGLAGVPQT